MKAQREAMKRKREGSQEEGSQGRVHLKKVILESVAVKDVTQYHPILEAIIDPVKRKKLEAICMALKRRNLQSLVYYGCGAYSVSFDMVEEILDATG